MAIVELVMPKMGESIVEATIITWLKKVGEQVQAEEPILEVATDKVDSEVPSTVTGKLIEILHDSDAVVPVGGILARIETDAVSKTPVEVPPPATVKEEEVTAPAMETQVETPVKETSAQPSVVAAPTPAVSKKVSLPTAQLSSSSGGRFYSPLVRNIAKAEGISMAELDTVPGSGAEDRVNKTDLINYIKAKQQGLLAQIPNPLIQPIATQATVGIPAPMVTTNAASDATKVSAAPTATAVKASSNDDIIEMDRMRRVIAQHMKNSQNVSATVTSMVEADATHLVHWRNRHKDAYQQKHGEKLTFSPLFTEAVIKAIADYPTINASIDGNNLIVKKDINIGIATAMQNGNLIVPVIKKAQDLNLVGLATKLNDITGRARVNGLKPDEITGGTFTISNIGTYGNIMGTPIINQPELAILALGAIKKKPVIQETPHGDIIAIRHMMFLSLSFDHRIIDGYLGGVFLNRIAHYIESFDPNRSI